MLGAVAFGCGGSEPVGPSVENFSEERNAAAERIAKRRGKGSQGTAVKKAKPRKQESGGFGAVNLAYRYDSNGKRDPFRSFEWERRGAEALDDELRGPLEKFDLAQLDLVAVVWESNRAKALVEDPSGESYIVGFGTRMGKNEGTVTEIQDSAVVVRETYVDNVGQKSTKDIEMRLRGSEGG